MDLPVITDPGRRPWAKAVGLGLALLAVPLLWWSLLRLVGIAAPAPVADGLPVPLVIAAAVAIAPLVETAVLALVHWLAVTVLRLPVPAFVALVAGVAMAAHLPISLVRTPVTVAIFLVFALQYAGWSARGRWLAFGATALTHAVYNAGSLALSPLWALLLRPA